MNAPFLGYILWLVFLASWYVAMLWTAKAVSRASARQSLGYTAGLGIAFVLLFASSGAGWRGDAHLWPVLLRPMWRPGSVSGAALVCGEVAGFAFAWWARIHLGRLWSGMMTLREGHRVVDTGPYRIVRHPIYTGYMAAAWCYAGLLGSPVALGGAVVLTVVMAVKSRDEEALLRRELGAAAYDAYAARTARLVPFGPR